MNYTIPIIIPSLEPDENLPKLVKELKQAELSPIVIVDDGSGKEYRGIFDELEQEHGCILLRNAVNLGKGRALKNAFNFCINNFENMIGCITADSDGQHTVECIKKCKEALIENQNSLVLGVRDFSGEDIPAKSRFGNNLTKWVCKNLCGVNVSDTQTGLRAIPTEFMKNLLSLKGERFEFETRMLLEAKDKFPIVEVPIKTIYDSKDNHATHFDPIKDSIRIYKIFLGQFGRFLFSSLSSSVVDLVLFALFCKMLVGIGNGEIYVAIATVFARVISAVYNYLINYIVVFHSGSEHKKSAVRYFGLAVVQMLCSAGIVTGIATLLPALPKLIIKIPVDIILFFASFCIQREFVYKDNK